METLKDAVRACMREIYNTPYHKRQPETYLFRDVLFYTWLLQRDTKQEKGPIDMDVLTQLCCTQSRGALSIPIYYWWVRDFFDVEAYKRNRYVLTPTAMNAINEVFSEPEFGYLLHNALPGSKMTGMQFIRQMNHLDPPATDLSKTVAMAFKHVFPPIGFLPVEIDEPSVQERMFVTEISNAQANWQFWVAVVHADGTLSRTDYINTAFMLVEAVANGLTPHVLLIYPSVDNAEGVANRVNRSRGIYGMTEMGAVRYMNILADAASQGSLTKDLIEMFDEDSVANETVMSFDYPPSFIMQRMQGSS